MSQDPLIRVRLGLADARTETGQVEPSRLLDLFSDAAARLAIQYRRDQGILRAYQSIEWVAPLRVGDYIDIRARVIDAGRKALTIELVAHLVARAARSVDSPLAGEMIDPPRLVARATGVWIVPEAVIAEGETPAAEEGSEEEYVQPLSWGGHRPKDRPPDRRRPGPDVHIRSDDEMAARPPYEERPRRSQSSSESPRSRQGSAPPRDDRPPRSGSDRPPRSSGSDRPPRGGSDRPRSGSDRPPRGGSDRPPRKRE